MAAPIFDSLTMVQSRDCLDPRQGVESEQCQSQRLLPSKGPQGSDKSDRKFERILLMTNEYRDCEMFQKLYV